MAIQKDTIQLEVVINGTKSQASLREMRASARSLKQELDNIKDEKAFRIKAEELRLLNNRIAQATALTRGTGQAFQDAAARAFPLLNTFKQLGVAGVAFFAVERVARWTKEIFQGIVALEDMRDKAARTFGESIAIIEDFAAINAQQLGVTEDKYASLAASIGASLVNMGLAREEAAKMASEATNLSGALSEWSNGQVSVEQTTEILRKALQGQTRGLKELGIVISDTDIKSRLSAQGLQDLTGKALAQAKAQTILQLITEKSRDAQIEFAASSDDAGRAQSRILQFFNQQKETLLNNLLPAYKAVTNAVANFLSPLKRHSDLTRELQAQFNVQIETLKASNISQENRVKLIDQINSKYKEYLPNLITEKTTLQELSKIQDEVNKKFEQRILQLATEEALREETAKSIELKVQELDIAQKLSEAIIEKEKASKLAATAGRAEGRSVSDSQRAYQDATLAVGKYSDALTKNQQKQQEQVEKVKQVTEAAKKLGLDINAILNQGGPLAPGDDPAPTKKSAAQIEFERRSALIDKERQIRLRLNDALVQSDKEASLQREIINLESDNKIADARIEIFKNAAKEQERLTGSELVKLQNEIVDRETTRIDTINELTLEKTTNLLEKERQLRIDDLNDDTLRIEEHARRLEIINRESDLKILEAKKQFVSSTSSEYDKLITEIGTKQKELDKLISNNQVLTQIELLEDSRAFALDALNQQKLDEADYQKSRQLINLQTDKKILEARLKVFDPNSAEAAKLRDQIALIDREISGISFLANVKPGDGEDQDDINKKKEKLQQLEAAAIDTAHNIANATFDIQREKIQSEHDLRIAAIDAEEKRKLEAAGDDAVLQKKIIAEAARDRLEAEKKFAREKKRIAKTEAIIQGALAVVEALPNPFAAVAAGIATAIQIAAIDAQTFAGGGYTPKRGRYRDHTGHEVAGIVHTNEWVAPRHMVDDPQTGPVISYLEQVRRSRRGFADGGFTSVSTIPTGFVQTSTLPGGSAELTRIYDVLKNIEQITANWPRILKAIVVLTELEAKQKEINYIRDQSVV